MNTYQKLPTKKTTQVYQYAKTSGLRRNGATETQTDPTNTLTSTLTTTHILNR